TWADINPRLETRTRQGRIGETWVHRRDMGERAVGNGAAVPSHQRRTAQVAYGSAQKQAVWGASQNRHTQENLMASQRKKGQTVGLSLSGISVLLSLGLAVWEMYFFWEAGKGLFGPLHGTLGLFTPERLGFNMAWLALAYLSFQLISVPFAMAYRDQ